MLKAIESENTDIFEPSQMILWRFHPVDGIYSSNWGLQRIVRRIYRSTFDGKWHSEHDLVPGLIEGLSKWFSESIYFVRSIVREDTNRPNLQFRIPLEGKSMSRILLSIFCKLNETCLKLAQFSLWYTRNQFRFYSIPTQLSNSLFHLPCCFLGLSCEGLVHAYVCECSEDNVLRTEALFEEETYTMCQYLRLSWSRASQYLQYRTWRGMYSLFLGIVKAHPHNRISSQELSSAFGWMFCPRRSRVKLEHVMDMDNQVTWILRTDFRQSNKIEIRNLSIKLS